MGKKRVRRSQEEIRSLVLELADQGPFTSQDLASFVGFTTNRARQALEGLKESGEVAVLGQRKSRRGKPSTLWGRPGTEVSEEDQTARPPAKKAKTKTARSAPKKSAPSGAPGVAPLPLGVGFLGALAAFLERGVEIEDPRGEVYTIRLAGDGKA